MVRLLCGETGGGGLGRGKVSAHLVDSLLVRLLLRSYATVQGIMREAAGEAAEGLNKD